MSPAKKTTKSGKPVANAHKQALKEQVVPDLVRSSPPRAIKRSASDERRSEAALDTVPKSTGSKKKKRSNEKEWAYTHNPPNAAERSKNGRVEGRNLIAWGRPRMAEKLLLHMQYECARYKIELPWDSIAHRFHPGSSGQAVLQHLARLRPQLIAEGHLVPPVPQKPGSKISADPKIRGYVRRDEFGDQQTARSVTFEEPMDDRKFNLPDAYDNSRGTLQAALATQVDAEVRPSKLDSDDDYDLETPRGRRSTRNTVLHRSYIEGDLSIDEDAESVMGAEGERDAVEEEDDARGREGYGVSEMHDGADVPLVSDDVLRSSPPPQPLLTTLNGADCAAGSARSTTLVQELQALITTQVQKEIRKAFTNVQNSGYRGPFFRPHDPAPGENLTADEFGLVEPPMKEPFGLGLVGESAWEPSLSGFALEEPVYHHARLASASGSSDSHSPVLPLMCGPAPPDPFYISHDPVYDGARQFDLHDF